jgi:hypothetical protein
LRCLILACQFAVASGANIVAAIEGESLRLQKMPHTNLCQALVPTPQLPLDDKRNLARLDEFEKSLIHLLSSSNGYLIICYT